MIAGQTELTGPSLACRIARISPQQHSVRTTVNRGRTATLSSSTEPTSQYRLFLCKGSKRLTCAPRGRKTLTSIINRNWLYEPKMVGRHIHLAGAIPLQHK